MIDMYDSQAAQSEFHKETQNFFKWVSLTFQRGKKMAYADSLRLVYERRCSFAKRIAVEVQPEPLFFSDLAPVADSMPTVAAQACRYKEVSKAYVTRSMVADEYCTCASSLPSLAAGH